jgi:hypothetical protein
LLRGALADCMAIIQRRLDHLNLTNPPLEGVVVIIVTAALLISDEDNMIYQNQIIAMTLATDHAPDPGGSGNSDTFFTGPRIRSIAIVALNVFHGGDSEVLIRYLTANDDQSERRLLQNLDLETANVTIICRNLVSVRSTLRRRTMMLLDDQCGGSELIHRQVSSAQWLVARGSDVSCAQGDNSNLRELHCSMSAEMLVNELAHWNSTPTGRSRFEHAVELLKVSAADANLPTLAESLCGIGKT